MVSPKVLIISRTDYLRDKESEANTIRSFMTVFPQEDVRSILCGDFNLNKTGRLDNNTYQLGHKDIFGASLLMKETRQSSVSIVQSITPRKKGLSFRGWLKSLAINIYSLLPYKMSQDMRSFITDFHPDIIYTTFTNNREMLLARRISREWKIPMIPHFFDDWPNVYYKGSSGEILFKKLFNNRLKSVLKEVPVCLCISERMCWEYERRYSIDKSIQLLNCVDNNSCQNSTPPPKSFFYFGSLYLGRGETLKKLCEALSQKNYDICIYIGAPERHWEAYEPILGRYSFVKYLGFLVAGDLVNAITKADVLLFVESFEESMLDLTRLSLSTRIPELLATGKYILAMGHRDQGSIAYLKKHNAAYVIDNEHMIDARINDVIEGKNSEIVLKNASCLFRNNHERMRQQQLFYDTIQSVVGQNVY